MSSTLLVILGLGVSLIGSLISGIGNTKKMNDEITRQIADKLKK